MFILLGGFVLFRDSRSVMNRSCAVLFFCISIWNTVDIFGINASVDTVWTLQNFAALGWIGFPATILVFSLAFSKREKILKSTVFKAVLAAVLVMFILLQWNGELTERGVHQEFGWIFEWSDSIWAYIYYAYYIGATISGIVLIGLHGKHTNNVLEKKLSISLILGTITDVIIPIIDIYSMPQTANIVSLIFAIGMVYAIVKYSFFGLTVERFAMTIVSTMNDSLILCNTKGAIIFMNRAAESLLGYCNNELLEKHIEVFFDRQPDSRPFESVLSGERMINVDAFFTAKGGAKVPVSVSCSSIQEKESGRVGSIIVARDISESFKHEAERRVLAEQLEQAGKMAAVGQLASGVAHEINNPMTVILGFSQALKRNFDEKSLMFVPLASIEQEALRCRKIVQDLLVFSRSSKAASEYLDINETIDTAVSLELMQAKMKNVSISKEYGENLPKVLAGRSQLQSVIVNLFNNAFDALKDDGKILIRTEKGGLGVRLTVEDNGSGIPADIIKKIFDPFFTTKTVGKGTGLGLSLCYEIVTKIGGKISVESKVGAGTKFIIDLPAAEKESGNSLS